MTLLQAFTIYIICGRFDKRGPDVKHLTSLAIKTAQKNGLDKIDSNSMLSPFESEMRRRIWWQLYTLDVRNAEDHGLEPCISEPSVTTRLPLSINDLNLHPGMSEIRQSSSERTEMLFTLNRHNTSTLVRRIMFSDSFCQQNAYPVLSISEKCDEIDIAREKIEEQILALCNHDIPVDYITAASSRLVLAKLKLNVIKPKARQNQHIITQEGFRRTCVEILKSARALRCYENGKQWLWLFQTYVEWDALTYLFINLSLVPSGSTTDSAWQAAEDIYEYWRNHSEVVFDDRWKQIEGLRSHAFSARQMYRDNPAQFGPLPTEFDSPGGPSMMLSTRVEEAGLGGGHAGDLNLQSEITGGTYNPQPTDAMGVQASSQGKLTEACANVLEPGSSVDPLDISIPTTGTSCQWSAALFDRYFQVLDSEQNMAMSWL
ncbi:hypothetical protein N7468_009281 [Penicillium chermesinum]|uniref:Xylanolytic transcriptional activator regulatory domain-containing protein n=1 Tax=Penicillium chermesinum TaxID=63820 RepID=A0A9W9NHH3_9EURO|nr:uncharacterized protein N7468_009281 [Penicillium chermesinum]KAJ5220077.1 hypothetical protein N7468_009281 [Penicillium chermesinum]KAJ6157527.1 hypothetical protein N7470_005119 [Penicillium chermesinum]